MTEPVVEPKASDAALAAQGATVKDAGPAAKGAPVAPAAPLGDKKPAPAPTAEEVAKLAEATKAAELAAAEEAKKPVVPEVEENKDWQQTFIKIENPDAQAAIDLMEEAGVSTIEANAVFAEAIKANDLNLIDWATLEAKIGATKARLVKNGVEKYYNEDLSVQNQIVTDTYNQLGGKANWETLRTWAQNAETADKAVKSTVDGIRKMINLGGHARETAISQLKEMYDADPATTGFGTSKFVQGDQVVSTAGEPLGSKEYRAALDAANKSRAKPDVIEALRNRRKAGMQKGLK